jgi:hypothetical protein
MKIMKVNSSEYAYLSTLSVLNDKLISMIGEFTENQRDQLLPMINYTNEILNLDIDSFNQDVIQ